MQKTHRLKDLVNTPFKRVMFVVQIVNYMLIAGSPFNGGAIGGLLELTASKTGAIILSIFFTGEVLFCG